MTSYKSPPGPGIETLIPKVGVRMLPNKAMK